MKKESYKLAIATLPNEIMESIDQQIKTIHVKLKFKGTNKEWKRLKKDAKNFFKIGFKL